MIIKYWMFSTLVGSAVIFSACGGAAESNQTSTEETGADTTQVDTIVELEEKVVPERISYDVNKLLARLDTVFQLPYIIDSVMIDSLFMDVFYESDLSNAEAQYLGFTTPKKSPSSWSAYAINEYVDIDSIKMRGEYEDYVEQLDLGETQDASATLVGQVHVSDAEYYILWTTSYHTIDACPYGHGSYLWATYFKDNQPYEAVLVGENSGGGDPPHWSGTITTSVITKEGIEAFILTESGSEDYDTGEEIIESSEQTARYTLTDSALFVVETKEG